MRDDFSISIKEELAKRVAFLCSNPGCRQPTSGPQAAETGTVNIGVAAHLTAASPGGPRYDPSLTSEDRRSSKNGIWLCQTCGKLVDSDTGRYSIEKLCEWKRDAEAAAARALEQRRAPPSPSQGVYLEAERLMPKLLSEMAGDVQDDPTHLVREFVLLTQRGVSFAHPKKHFEYFKSEHPDLQESVDWLVDMGAVSFVRSSDQCGIYRMLPDFAAHLRRSGGAK